MKKLATNLHEQLETVISGMGFEFVGGEMFLQGGRTILRLYIDSEKGVTIDECGLVSRQVSAMLDVENPIQGRYNLEVSSPGIDRPLFELKHYQRFVGSKVRVRLLTNVDGRRQYKGLLKGVSGDNIQLVDDETGSEVTVPFSMIEKASLVGDVKKLSS